MDRIFHGFGDFEDRPLMLSDKSREGYRKAFLDLREKDKEFVIAAELPGIDKEDINLEIKDDRVVIKAEKKQEKEKGDYSYSKSYAGFYQEVALPENTDSDKIDAVYKDGVLKLTIPKKKLAVKKKEIKIK